MCTVYEHPVIIDNIEVEKSNKFDINTIMSQ